MKVLLTHRYYWPDTPPYAYILREIAEDLVKAGHTVGVFSTMPSYSEDKLDAMREEKMNGMHVSRMRVLAESKDQFGRRVLNSLLYCICAFWAVLRQRPDVVMAATFPPVLAGWTISLAAKLSGAKFVYHMQDIHPEVSIVQGGRMGQNVVSKIFRFLDNQTLKRAFSIVVLSEDMKRTLLRRGLDLKHKIHIINNFMFEDFSEKLLDIPELLEKKEKRVRVIFAGNMGRFQNLNPFVQAINLLDSTCSNIDFLFLGAGEDFAALERISAGNEQVTFHPAVPYSVAKTVISESDIGVVSLAKGISSVSYPSKTSVYFGSGIPIIAMVEKESALAKSLKEETLGVAIDDDNPDNIAKALIVFFTDFDSSIYEKPVRKHFVKKVETQKVLQAWRDIYSQPDLIL